MDDNSVNDVQSEVTTEPAYAPGTTIHSATTKGPGSIDLSESEDAVSDTDGPKSPSEDAEDVIGVSLGEAQTHLKSAKTPATEKTRALEESGDYFSDGLETAQAARHDAEKRSSNSLSADPDLHFDVKQDDKQGRDLPSPSTADIAGQAQRRSETSRSFLRDSLATSRKRASSGSAIFTEGLRRLIPDLSTVSKLAASPTKSITSPVKTTTSESTPTDDNFSGRTTRRQSEQAIFGPQRDSHHAPIGREPLTKYRGLHVGEPVPLRPQGLRRVTSDSSLFLKKQISSSTTESGHQWDHIQEQVNSRMKAIRDTWQDASFKMPKLPTMSLGQYITSAPQRNVINSARKANEVPGDGSMQRDNLERKTGLSNRQHATETHGAAMRDTAKTSRHPVLADALSRLDGDVVVLGGYRGSILRSAKPPQRQLWVPIKVGLNIRRVDLEVGLTAEDEERMEDNIIPSGSLSHIGPVDICRRLLKKLRTCRNAQNGELRVHDYGYDWRLSPHLLSRRLIAFLDNLKTNQLRKGHSWKGATIIAHSLGGLITRHAINLRPDLFAGVVYAGVPQHCVNILGPLRHGDAVLLSSRVLTAQVNFTMRTSFALLPEIGRCFFNKETGERYDLDFFDFRSWDEYRLSPCISAPLGTVPERSKSLMETVSSAVSNSISSLPNPARRSSWFFFGEPTSDNTSRPGTKATGAAQTAKEEVSKRVNALGHTRETLEPSMNDVGQSSSMDDNDNTCTIPRAAAMEYLSRTLDEVRKFKQELHFKEDLQRLNSYPPTAVLYGRTLPTVYGAKVASREAIKRSDAYDRLAFGTGDGVVLARAAMLPEGYKVVKDGLVASDRGHVGLLGDLEGVGACLIAVLEGQRKGIGLGRDKTG